MKGSFANASCAFLSILFLIYSTCITCVSIKCRAEDSTDQPANIGQPFQLAISSSTNIFYSNEPILIDVILQNNSTNDSRRLCSDLGDAAVMKLYLEDEKHDEAMNVYPGINAWTVDFPPHSVVKYKIDLRRQPFNYPKHLKLVPGTYNFHAEEKIFVPFEINVVSGGLTFQILPQSVARLSTNGLPPVPRGELENLGP